MTGEWSDQRRFWRRGIVFTSGLLVALSFACARKPQRQPFAERAPLPVECPGAVPGPVGSGAPSTNESHDCQRLIVNGNYAQMVALIAEDLEHSVDPNPTGGVYALVGRAPPNNSYPENSSPLGITSRKNCLFIRSTTNSNQIEAAIIPISPSDICSSASAGPGDYKLRGTRFPGSYPADIRWEWDAAGVYYIGLRCGNGWCVVGDIAPTGMPPSSTNGRGDSQVLAYEVGNKIRPSSLMGTIIPTTGTCPGAPDYTQTATIVITGDPADPAWAKYNALGLKMGQNSVCVRPPATNADKWAGKINGTSVKTEFYPRADQNKPHPESVRWQWSDDDEKVWSQCAQGCCSLG